MKKLIIALLIVVGLAGSAFAYNGYGCRPYPYRGGYCRGYAAGYRAACYPAYYPYRYYRPVCCQPVYIVPAYRPVYPVYTERAIEIGA